METGLTEWNQSGLVMGVSFGTIIVGSMVTIFFCVGRVWMKVNTFVHSQIFDKVQKELFKAQCVTGPHPRRCHLRSNFILPCSPNAQHSWIHWSLVCFRLHWIVSSH
ncbi:hypothetical protein CRE_22083 [Caenorhabditis remanei]|uniref:Uncharacterized protein n=1 Tax=Caenorhabditis remanei TaxID=31234 RepID=E3N8U9_CAERE|nr:hypothetical protein CRE_22083 [Caenorhabditis remanei]